jgi:thioredoxin-related protein
MNRWSRSLEIATNVAILMTCALIAFAILRPTASPASQARIAAPKVGDTISLQNVSWSDHKKTLVMAISTRCHYCSESKPFYHVLSEKAAASSTKLVAVLPDTTSESIAYLVQDKIRVDQVIQSSLDRIKVAGTPTLLLVDSNGRVLNSWIGKLDSAREADVLASL